MIEWQEFFTLTDPVFCYYYNRDEVEVKSQQDTVLKYKLKWPKGIICYAEYNSDIIEKTDDHILFRLNKKLPVKLAISYEWISPQYDFPEWFDDYFMLPDRYYEREYTLVSPKEFYAARLINSLRPINKDWIECSYLKWLKELRCTEIVSLISGYVNAVIYPKPEERKYYLQIDEPYIFIPDDSDDKYVISSYLVKIAEGYPLFEAGFNCTSILTEIRDTTLLPLELMVSNEYGRIMKCDKALSIEYRAVKVGDQYMIVGSLDGTNWPTPDMKDPFNEKVNSYIYQSIARR